MVLGKQSGSSKEQEALLTTELSLQPSSSSCSALLLSLRMPSAQTVSKKTAKTDSDQAPLETLLVP